MLWKKEEKEEKSVGKKLYHVTANRYTPIFKDNCYGCSRKERGLMLRQGKRSGALAIRGDSRELGEEFRRRKNVWKP